jgi:RNA polymerase sigma-70 factor, ECF subfamily
LKPSSLQPTIAPMDVRGVQGAFATGSGQWPEVCLGLETFDRYLRDVMGDAPASDWARHAADLYLCCGCLSGSTHAQRILDAQFLTRLVTSLARIDSSEAFVQDTLQTLRTKLLVGPDPRILAYSGRGPLLAWLRVSATRLALDSLRASARRAPHMADPWAGVVASELDPYSGMLKARYASAFQRALHDALLALSERDRNLLRLRLVDGCGIDRLGCMYQVDRATAARWLKSAKDRVFRGVRQTLGGMFGLTHQEFQSIARVVLSQLDFRASVLLDASAADPGPLEVRQGSPEAVVSEGGAEHGG